MEIKEILTKLYSYHLQTKGIPKADHPAMRSIAMETFRKFGSWRNAVWAANATKDLRKEQRPRAKFVFKNGKLEPTRKSLLAIMQYLKKRS